MDLHVHVKILPERDHRPTAGSVATSRVGSARTMTHSIMAGGGREKGGLAVLEANASRIPDFEGGR